MSLSKSGKWAGHVFVNKPGGFNSGYYLYIKPNLKLSLQPPDWLEKELVDFALNPAEYASAYGKKTGRCCFCSLELTDPRSVSAGYGPVCSEKWSLPWGQEDKPPKVLQEKKKNEDTWKSLEENFGEIIAKVKDEMYYDHCIGGSRFFSYGESVKDMCEEYEAYWLLDAIASYQYKARSHPQMRNFQIWELKVDLDKHEAILIGSWDTGKPVYRRRISYTDFPNQYIKLYLENNILIFVEER